MVTIMTRCRVGWGYVLFKSSLELHSYILVRMPIHQMDQVVSLPLSRPILMCVNDNKYVKHSITGEDFAHH